MVLKFSDMIRIYGLISRLKSGQTTPSRVRDKCLGISGGRISVHDPPTRDANIKFYKIRNIAVQASRSHISVKLRSRKVKCMCAIRTHSKLPCHADHGTAERQPRSPRVGSRSLFYSYHRCNGDQWVRSCTKVMRTREARLCFKSVTVRVFMSVVLLCRI